MTNGILTSNEPAEKGESKFVESSLESWDKLAGYMLIVGIGIFGALPPALALLHPPYLWQTAIWIVAGVGFVAVVSSALLKYVVSARHRNALEVLSQSSIVGLPETRQRAIQMFLTP